LTRSTSPVVVRYSEHPVAVRFLYRPNRYLSRVERISDGARWWAHVPNPGRMEELLLPAITRGYAVAVPSAHRQTAFDLVAVRHGNALVSIDSRIANRVIGEALRSGRWPEAGTGGWRAEQRWGAHRFDFARFEGKALRPSTLLEVKSSNLRVGRTALFPDAPTERGRRHLEALTRAVRRGVRSIVLFALQRSDVDEFTPNRVLDPEFGRAFDRARRAGVEFRAFRLHVRPGSVQLAEEVPVR
jgi:sugar fermentation stimulation protein A